MPIVICFTSLSARKYLETATTNVKNVNVICPGIDFRYPPAKKRKGENGSKSTVKIKQLRILSTEEIHRPSDQK